MSEVRLNIFVTDGDSGAPIPGCVVIGYGPLVPPQFNTRFTQGDGGCNFYVGPPVAVQPFSYVVVPASGYQPSCSTDQPVEFGPDTINLSVKLKSFKRPFKPAPRAWAGNMCGVRVEGIEAVAGGAADPTLVLSWFYDRYTSESRAKIRAVWKAKGLLDVLLSWPDSRAFGRTPEQFRDTINELQADGFRCCPFLCAKGIDPPDVPTILANIAPVLPLLVRVVPRSCIGWELSLWLTPTQVQELIDALAPTFTAYGCKVYVHFQEGYMSFQVDGGIIADFWNANIGKLTGVLYQKKLAQNDAEFLDSINDCLQRCAGNFFMPLVIIDGHPVDFIGLELSAQWQFNGEMTEAQGDALGRLAINAPHVLGPAGEVMVMGSGNGA